MFTHGKNKYEYIINKLYRKKEKNNNKNRMF